MRLINKIILILTAGLILFPSAALAAGDSQLFEACKQAPSSPICRDQGTTTNPVNRTIHAAATIVAVLTGLAAVVIIIIAGITLITSAGNTEAVANSRKRIIYAVTGLVIVALAWTIINFLIDKLIKT